MRVAKVKSSEAIGHRTTVRGKTKIEIVLQNLNNPSWDAGEDYNRCFHCYDNISEFEKYLMHRDNIWVIYKLGGEFSRNKQQKYEHLVFGWLQYYDLQVKEGEINHTIYFHWGKLNREPNSNFCVAIFISPAPVQTDDPVSEDRKYDDEINPPPAAGFTSNPPKPPPPPPPY